MADTPWTSDACSLVEAFRRKERSPAEGLDATLAAIDDSDLNCFSFVDPERARRICAKADVSLPFGGIPTGIKELFPYEGWPHTEASLAFKDRVADHTSRHLERLVRAGGIVPVGLTTASEFGGLNVSVTRLNGVTHNPWKRGRTVGGSSGGSSAAVAGGLVALANGSDGGGSLRIPAGYTGLVSLKGTFGRITRAPQAFSRPLTDAPNADPSGGCSTTTSIPSATRAPPAIATSATAGSPPAGSAVGANWLTARTGGRPVG